jgi:hypothetical protein
MCVVALSLAMVGSSSLLGNPADSKNTTLGILFILLGQFCNSVQMVVEETFLKHRHYTPLNVVGMEGIFGMFVMLFFVLPALYFVPVTNENFHDDLWDALVQISNSSSLLALVLVYLFSISVYNFCGLSIAKKMTTVHRTLVDASTTVLIWLVELIAFYAGATEFGEGWSVWSWMEVGGFAILFLGNCIYNGVLRLPYFRYPQPKTGLVVFDSENEVSDFERGDDGHLGLGGDEDEDEDMKVQFTAEKVLN